MLPRGTRMCEAAEGDEVSNAARTQQPRENDITELRPFRVDISGAAIDDLRERLARTRWPEKEPVGDWSMGIPLAYVQELAGYWEKILRHATRRQSAEPLRAVHDDDRRGRHPLLASLLAS